MLNVFKCLGLVNICVDEIVWMNILFVFLVWVENVVIGIGVGDFLFVVFLL